MPKFNDILLPVVSISLTADELDKLSAKLATEPMPVEAMIEVAIYLKREKEKTALLDEAIAVLRGRMDADYAKRPEEKRKRTETGVGMLTYSPPGERVQIKDRDTTVESLTSEQLRASYKPDVKALEVMLKKDAFERLIERVPTKASTSLRDNKKSDFEEIDF